MLTIVRLTRIKEREPAETPSTVWQRLPANQFFSLEEDVFGVPDKEILFEKPGDLESTPCTKQSGEPGPDDKPLDWSHYPGGKKPEDDKDLPFNRPGNL